LDFGKNFGKYGVAFFGSFQVRHLNRKTNRFNHLERKSLNVEKIGALSFEGRYIMDKNDIFRLILSIIVCQMAGIIGSALTTGSLKDWYPTLVTPSFTPPGSTIGLIWIILFTLMGVSLFLVWREVPENPAARTALYFFGAQLIVNVLWNVAFFSLRSPASGLMVIAVLWILILITIVKFWPINKTAALLLVPYIIWVSVAAYLNYSLWILNS
jgi:benzodiazapine receptor